MKINSVSQFNSPSFGAIVFNNDYSKSQKKAVDRFFSNPLYSKQLVKDLEEDDTDIVITPWKSNDNVDIELSSEVGVLGERYTPKDKYGYPIKTTINEYCPNCDTRIKDALAAHWFLNAANNLNLSSPRNVNCAEDIMQELDNA